jgi:hypothetical protein
MCLKIARASKFVKFLVQEFLHQKAQQESRRQKNEQQEHGWI